MTPARPWAQRAARSAVWGAVALGGLGGLFGLVRPAPTAPSRDAVEARPSAIPVPVSGFAELAVRTWLTADEASEAAVDALFVVDPQLPTGNARRSVVSASTVAARPVADGYWAVTVAVELSEVSVDNHLQPAGIRFFEVGVVEDDAGVLAAVSEPAMVPALHANGRLRHPAGPTLTSPDPTDPLTATVLGFLQALLAGGGDVSRYLAPGVAISAVDPRPFTEVTVARQSVVTVTDTRARVRAEIRGESALGGTWTLAYELELTARDGRWEVQSLSGAPTLTANTPRGEAPPDPPPPSAPATEPSQPITPEPGA